MLFQNRFDLGGSCKGRCGPCDQNDVVAVFDFVFPGAKRRCDDPAGPVSLHRAANFFRRGNAKSALTQAVFYRIGDQKRMCRIFALCVGTAKILILIELLDLHISSAFFQKETPFDKTKGVFQVRSCFSAKRKKRTQKERPQRVRCGQPLLVGETCSAFGSSARQNFTPVSGRHSFAETVLFFSLQLFGLICSEHSSMSLLSRLTLQGYSISYTTLNCQ